MTPETYNSRPYYPFNLDNLNIAGTPHSDADTTHAHADSDTDTHTDSDADTDTHADADADAHSDTDATPLHADPPPAPSNLTAVVAGPDQINLYWNPSSGATQYIVERSVDGGTWTVLARGPLGVLFRHRSRWPRRPTTIASWRLPAPAARRPVRRRVAETDAAVDSLSVQPLNIAATRKSPFIGAVATFTDANTLTAAGSFVAMIRWGDGSTSRGTVSGGDGQLHGDRPTYVFRRGPFCC